MKLRHIRWAPLVGIVILLGLSICGFVSHSLRPPAGGDAFNAADWKRAPRLRYRMWESASNRIVGNLNTVDSVLAAFGPPDSQWTNAGQLHLLYSLGSQHDFPPINLLGLPKRGLIDLWYLHVTASNAVVVQCKLVST